jgi:acetyltransferase-like isoleucine patch superfamily enzyme
MKILNIKTQAGLFIIAFHNILYNIIPFFFLKNFYLSLTGAKIGKCTYIHILVRFTFLGKLFIGDNTTINFGCFLDNRGDLRIGNNVMIGHNSKIYTTGHDIRDNHFQGFYSSVDISDNVVIFPNTIIMPGVKIGKNAIILNGSVITKDVDKDSVMGGNPARFIKSRESTPEYKLDYGFWFTNS